MAKRAVLLFQVPKNNDKSYLTFTLLLLLFVFYTSTPLISEENESDLYPTLISIGTNTGARIAHLADADPINRLRNPTTRMNPRIRGIPVIPVASRKFAPLTARIVPRLE